MSVGDRLMAGTLVLAVSIAIGWAGGFAWRELPLITQLWNDASEERYLAMSDDDGPVTYLVTHEDARRFADRALALDGVLGVEPHESTRVSAIAFTSAEEPAIETVRTLSGVLRVQRRAVPMLCL